MCLHTYKVFTEGLEMFHFHKSQIQKNQSKKILLRQAQMIIYRYENIEIYEEYNKI